MTRVFPVPAPARTSTGPLRVWAASRCAALRWLRWDDIRDGKPRREGGGGDVVENRGEVCTQDRPSGEATGFDATLGNGGSAARLVKAPHESNWGVPRPAGNPLGWRSPGRGGPPRTQSIQASPTTPRRQS